MKKEDKLGDLSMQLSVDVLNMCKALKKQGESTISNQISRSATSICANIAESKYAHGRADFIAKLQIALKECYETEYWIELILDGGYYSNNDIQEQCIEIKKILIASVTTAKEKSK